MRETKRSTFLDIVVSFLVILFSYLVAFWAVNNIIGPVQKYLLGNSVLASLLFLPHGIRVLGTWLWRERAVPPLIIGEVIATLWIWQYHAPLNHIIFAATIGGSCCFLLLEVFRLLNLDLYPSHVAQPNWKALVFVAALSSVLNSLGHVFAYQNTLPSREALLQAANFLIGDTLGTVVLMVLLMFGFRFARLRVRR